MRIHTVFSISLSMIVVGCAIRPLPKDVTRDTTLEIINKIRCEARGALVERILLLIGEPREGALKSSPKNVALLRKLDAMGTSESVMKDIDFDKVDDLAKGRLLKIAASSITYAFIFTISENKTKKGGATFTMPFTKGMFTLGLGVGSNKTRKNVRSITVVDTFFSLVTGLSEPDGSPTGLNCENISKPRKHWVYPITGNIGLSEVVNTFIDTVNVSRNVSTFSDKLTYTTDFDMSINPMVTLDPPLPKKLKLTKANIDYSAKRSDAHEVTLSFIAIPLSLQKEIKTSQYKKIMDLDKIDALPNGAEIGITFKKTKKIDEKLSGKDVKIKKITSGEKTDQQEKSKQESKKLFSVPNYGLKDALKESIRRGIAESQRLESADRQRDLDALIGR